MGLDFISYITSWLMNTAIHNCTFNVWGPTTSVLICTVKVVSYCHASFCSCSLNLACHNPLRFVNAMFCISGRTGEHRHSWNRPAPCLPQQPCRWLPVHHSAPAHPRNHSPDPEAYPPQDFDWGHPFWEEVWGWPRHQVHLCLESKECLPTEGVWRGHCYRWAGFHCLLSSNWQCTCTLPGWAHCCFRNLVPSWGAVEANKSWDLKRCSPNPKISHYFEVRGIRDVLTSNFLQRIIWCFAVFLLRY